MTLLDDPTIFRVYEPHEVGRDGYPAAWHKLEALDITDWTGPFPAGVKHLVRHHAGDRCERCRHPYRTGESGVWNTDLIAPADLDLADRLLLGGERVSPKRGLKRIQWSPCDDQCRHTGPMRVHTTEGWSPFNPTPEACGPAVYAVSPARAEAAWRILTVHHLNSHKADLRWWNLCALCQRCHLHIQRKVQMHQVWPLEHTDWFRSHAAGYYAYAYLGEDLTRSETLARLDELLDLERAA